MGTSKLLDNLEKCWEMTCDGLKAHRGGGGGGREGDREVLSGDKC